MGTGTQQLYIYITFMHLILADTFIQSVPLHRDVKTTTNKQGLKHKRYKYTGYQEANTEIGAVLDD